MIHAVAKHARTWGSWALLAIAISGLPQLALAVEDGNARAGSGELRAVRVLLFGDRATSSTTVMPLSVVTVGSKATFADADRDRSTFRASSRRADLLGRTARLGPPKRTIVVLHALRMGSSNFV